VVTSEINGRNLKPAGFSEVESWNIRKAKLMSLQRTVRKKILETSTNKEE
jgi:hypothetical protein